jgi:hypothetical protein
MDVKIRSSIKKWGNCQTNLIIDSDGTKFIEKITFYNPLNNTFDLAPYNSNEFEIYDSILKPLKIPHINYFGYSQTAEYTKFIMDFIDGIFCENVQEAKYLYLAAEEIGKICYISKANMIYLDKSIINKYILDKSKVYEHINASNYFSGIGSMDSVIDFIFDKYKSKPAFINHFDMHFKNFIYDTDLHIIDWASLQISPFLTDLYVLLSQAKDVNADPDEIKKHYLKYAQINSLSDFDINIGGIIWSIVNIHWLLDLHKITNAKFFLDWAEELFIDLQNLITLLSI